MNPQRNRLIGGCAIALVIALTAATHAQEAKPPTAVVTGAAEAEAAQKARIKALADRLAATQVQLSAAQDRCKAGLATAAEVAEMKATLTAVDADLAAARAIAGKAGNTNLWQLITAVEKGQTALRVALAPPPGPYARKLREVILPRLDFADLPLSEAVAALRKAAAESPQKFPVNIVVVPDLMTDVDLKVTLSLNNVSLFDAIRYIAMIVRLQCLFEENAVVLSRGEVNAPAR
jgi:hypothetical protein